MADMTLAVKILGDASSLSGAVDSAKAKIDQLYSKVNNPAMPSSLTSIGNGMQNIGDKAISNGRKFTAAFTVPIVAGAKSDIQYPKDSDWIELGYINDAMNLMSISDVVVIPNRNTYFDLVIIEALSLGKIVVTSNTGGNIDIAKTNRGLYLFDNNSEISCTEAIKHVLSMSNPERRDLETCSRKYYLENCTPEVFAENYLRVINEFINIQ